MKPLLILLILLTFIAAWEAVQDKASARNHTYAPAARMLAGSWSIFLPGLHWSPGPTGFFRL
jgi:hypothetical protein